MSCCGRRDTPRSKSGYHHTLVTWMGPGMQKIPGNVTGKVYRFNGDGGEALIDDRDLSGVLNIPHMEIIKS